MKRIKRLWAIRTPDGSVNLFHTGGDVDQVVLFTTKKEARRLISLFQFRGAKPIKVVVEEVE